MLTAKINCETNMMSHHVVLWGVYRAGSYGDTGVTVIPRCDFIALGVKLMKAFINLGKRRDVLR